MTTRRETDFRRNRGDGIFGLATPPTRSLAARSALWLGGAGLVVSLLMAQLGDSGIPAVFRLSARADALQQEVDGLQEDVAALDENLARLAGDDEYLEQIARVWYGMKRPHEMVVRVTEKAGS